jgi:hypothetical protein
MSLLLRVLKSNLLQALCSNPELALILILVTLVTFPIVVRVL